MGSLVQEVGLFTTPSGFHYGEDLNTVKAPNGEFDNLTVGAFLTDAVNPATPGAGVSVDQLNIKYDAGTTTQTMTAVGAGANIGITITPKGTGAVTLGNEVIQPLASVTTVGAVTATIWTTPTVAGGVYDMTAYVKGTTGALMVQYEVKLAARNVGGVLTVLPLSTYGNRDPALIASNLTAAAVGTNIVWTVLGVAAQTLTWTGKLVSTL